MKSVLLFVLCALSVVRSEDIPGELYVLDGGVEYTAVDFSLEPEEDHDFALIFVEKSKITRIDSGLKPLHAVLKTNRLDRRSIFFNTMIDERCPAGCELGTGGEPSRLKGLWATNRPWTGVNLDPPDSDGHVQISRSIKKTKVIGQLEPFDGVGVVAPFDVSGFTLKTPIHPPNVGTAKLCFRQPPPGPPPTGTPSGPSNVPAPTDQ